MDGTKWQQHRYPETERKNRVITSNEVILLKPENEKDDRSNDDIKKAVIKRCDKIKDKIKVKNVRQMRQKGIIMEVDSRQDAKLIEQINLKEIGLKIESPKKHCPSIMIYDVEKKLTKEELKEDLINKNFAEILEERRELEEKIIFKYGYNTKENCVNWMVQLPALLYNLAINKGRIFIAWRSYRLRDFVNIIRCYKCHGLLYLSNCARNVVKMGIAEKNVKMTKSV